MLAFGLSSVIDGSASAVLIWRFRREPDRAGGPSPDLRQVERVATRTVAVAMMASAAYVLVQAGRALIQQARPEQGALGIGLLIGSVLVLPPVGVVKHHHRRAVARGRAGRVPAGRPGPPPPGDRHHRRRIPRPDPPHGQAGPIGHPLRAWSTRYERSSSDSYTLVLPPGWK
ncbi:hypothetical protein [Streptomyces sp. RKAG293]|uniref:hypothetical protein n=1 Tax=Streptomyces sp. RKAG293 TaxID=2893403 RepID=UPI0035A846DC